MSGQQTTAGAMAVIPPKTMFEQNQPPITWWLILFFASMERGGHKQGGQQHEAELKQSFICNHIESYLLSCTHFCADSGGSTTPADVCGQYIINGKIWQLFVLWL